MASSAKPKPPPPLTSSPYPFAAAPDIIRAHQKDAYFQGVIANQLSDLHRRLRGARSAHAWASEAQTFAELLYLSLTTLLGNRTLGEEYCDLVQVEAPSSQPRSSSSRLPFLQHNHTQHGGERGDGSSAPGAGGPQLPTLTRRAGYITTSVLLPYLLGRILPAFRSTLRKRLQSRLSTLSRQQHSQKPPRKNRGVDEYRIVRYMLEHLTTLTSGTHIRAVTLAVFYFTGAYYSLSKRIFGLRYVFTRRIDESPGGGGQAAGRAGYEVLGVLLVVQMAVRMYMHIRDQLLSPLQSSDPDNTTTNLDLLADRERAALGPINVSLDANAYSSNNELLGLSSNNTTTPGTNGQRTLEQIGNTTHTPVPKRGNRYDLAEKADVMGWIKGGQQRKCTLCLEEMKDPSATQCGHVFCWVCIGDWVREKPECPLCRREAMVQHILPLRVA